MAKRAVDDEPEYWVATLPPTPLHRRLAFAVIAVTLAAYAAILPFSNTPLPRIDSFTPTVMAIVFVTDLITAVLLFAQFSTTGSRPLLILASGYLFSSLIAIPYTLTFPGAFAPTDLLRAGPQSAAWLNIWMRFGLAAATVGYALLPSGRRKKGSLEPSRHPAIFWSAAIVVALVCALTAAVTAAHDFIPRLLDAGHILPLGYYANGMIALMNVFALVILWSRGKSVLDLWLMVAVSALIIETALVALLVPTRFSVVFYAIRVITLLVSKVVLIVLVSETMRLYARLSIANRNLQRERANRFASAEAAVAAIAHEVKQPLTSMSMRAGAGQQFLDRASPDVGEAKLLFQQIKADAFRANEVFETFLALFRERNEPRGVVDMNELAREAAELLHNELGVHNVTVIKKFASQLPLIPGARGQLRELLLNLMQNAIEAMATTTNRPQIMTVATRLDSDSVRISVQDTGPGINPQRLPDIFESFVTTKAKGTGLGLGICKMVVDRHSGKLSAASDGGAGARFEITLPVT